MPSSLRRLPNPRCVGITSLLIAAILGQSVLISEVESAHWRLGLDPSGIAVVGNQKIGFGKGKFVSGPYFSTNGKLWESLEHTVEADIFEGGAFYGFVLDNFVSYDGESFHSEPGLPGFRLAVGNGIFVAVGRAGQIATRPFGTDLGNQWNWTWRTAPTKEHFTSIDFSDGVFYATAETPSNPYKLNLFGSLDGVLWSLLKRDISTGGSYFQSSAVLNDRLFIFYGSQYVVVDLSNFETTTQSMPSGSFSTEHMSVVGEWLFSGGYSGIFAQTSNGIDWEVHDTGTTYPIRGVAFGSEVWVLSTESGFLYSEDFLQFEPTSRPIEVTPNFVINVSTEVGNLYQLQVSTDGSTWHDWNLPFAGDGTIKQFIVSKPDRSLLFRALVY